MLQYMAVSRFNSFLCVRVCLQNGMPQLESTRNCRCWGFSNRSETASERQCPCTLRPQNKANQTMTQYCSHCPIRHESSMSNPMKSILYKSHEINVKSHEIPPILPVAIPSPSRKDTAKPGHSDAPAEACNPRFKGQAEDFFGSGKILRWVRLKDRVPKKNYWIIHILVYQKFHN